MYTNRETTIAIASVVVAVVWLLPELLVLKVKMFSWERETNIFLRT